MEDRALATLKAMLNERGLTGEIESIGSKLDDAKLYSFAGILVIFSTKTRISEKDLNIFIEYANENKYSNGSIIIGLSRPSDAVLTALRTHINQRDVPPIWVFELRHLQFRYGNHIKVPKHRIVDSKELVEILQKTNAKTPSVFRKIDSQDPMAKWVGARPGDVLEVTGMCESSVENKRYLFCMADVTNG
jgi:DNA-directed RNA polymerase subunit H (RpoH/RPB5)